MRTTGWFHLSDGFCFLRLGDGSVLIEVRTPLPGGGEHVYSTTATAAQWSSVVSSVSASGETETTRDAALKLHNQETKGS